MTDGEGDETDGEEDQDENEELDDEEDRILVAEETALRKLNSKSSKLGGGGSGKKMIKKQARLVARAGPNENRHRGCGLVTTNPFETQADDDPMEDSLGQGRRRHRRRRRYRRRRQYPLKGTYRRYRRYRRRRRRCTQTPRRHY